MKRWAPWPPQSPGDRTRAPIALSSIWHGTASPPKSGLVSRQGRTVGETLAETAKELNAGLLVMGGYGHSRLREIVLGGATRHMLSNPTAARCCWPTNVRVDGRSSTMAFDDIALFDLDPAVGAWKTDRGLPRNPGQPP